MHSGDIDSAYSHFVWQIWDITSVMAADLVKVFSKFSNRKTPF